MEKMKRILAMTFLMVLAGCAAAGPVYTPQALSSPTKDKAQLVIFRPSSLIGAAESPMILVNGAEKCEVPGGSFFVIPAEPGKAMIVTSTYGGLVKSSLSLNLSPSRRYYIKVSANAGKAFAGGMGALGSLAHDAVAEDTGTFIIRPVSKDLADIEIAGTKQSMSCK